ncbi:MAG: DUF3857 and transglutaminase domain-containing protein [Acidobacteria bacterium]|nr:DUF3857 and transglutaminase domain-containing protein [Acidobacteriota bacterium]MBI3425999.1 DUF3857 and transglutaminase domain-containing protein [Acidobacteriota bacterium]
MKRQLWPVRLLLLFAASCLLNAPASAQWNQWKPIDPAHVALPAPTIDKSADAEALFWEVYVNDANQDTEYLHYLRVKIFTERGKETQGKVELPYFNNVQIKDITARTIKPDGTIIELKKDAIFDREVVKFGKFKIKVKSFAMPAVEPGVIIEYRWREVRQNQMADNVPLQFQREIPVQNVRYYLKPYPYATQPMKSMTFQTRGQMNNFVKAKDGYWLTEMNNVPAFHEEPYMPPENQVRTWMLVYYAADRKQAPQQYWQEIGKVFYEVTKADMKVNDEVRKAAAEAIGDAATPEQKLERLFNFCRTKIKNLSDDASGYTPEQLQKLKDNKSPADTLKRGYGWGSNINGLFAALATAAGFDARYAVTSDRSRSFFDANFLNLYFMRGSNIAVKVGEQWRFFDPASTYVPFGMLRWQEEGIKTLIADNKEATFVPTPLSPPEKSLSKRVARLKLNEDGSLEGVVRVEYTGHAAVEFKEDYDDATPAQREEKLKNAVQSRLGCELSEIKIEPPNDPVKPFVYSYKIKAPGYAERTGKRLFLQPAFFQKGIAPLFSTNTREHDIYFHYAWLEQDDVEIELPAGYALDNAEAPASFPIGDFGNYKVTLGLTADQKILVYHRDFKFGGLIFPKSNYAPLKQAFDTLHQQDNHAITLKQGVAAVK